MKTGSPHPGHKPRMLINERPARYLFPCQVPLGCRLPLAACRCPAHLFRLPHCCLPLAACRLPLACCWPGPAAAPPPARPKTKWNWRWSTATKTASASPPANKPMRRAPAVAIWVITAEHRRDWRHRSGPKCWRRCRAYVCVAGAPIANQPIYVMRGILHSNPTNLHLMNGADDGAIAAIKAITGRPAAGEHRPSEIIRGPGSALYGCRCLRRVINIITKTAADIGGIAVGARVGASTAKMPGCSTAAISARWKWQPICAGANRRPERNHRARCTERARSYCWHRQLCAGRAE